MIATPLPRQGIVIGIRTLRNGEVASYGWDEPLVFRGKENLTAYLVAWDLRRKPVLVLPEHLSAAPFDSPACTDKET